jgi:hypothetical protein
MRRMNSKPCHHFPTISICHACTPSERIGVSKLFEIPKNSSCEPTYHERLVYGSHGGKAHYFVLEKTSVHGLAYTVLMKTQVIVDIWETAKAIHISS